MTIDQATAQRDAILQSLGISRTQFQQRSTDYSVGDARIKELSYLEDLITRLTAQPNGSPRNRSTYASFRRE